MFQRKFVALAIVLAWVNACTGEIGGAPNGARSLEPGPDLNATMSVSDGWRSVKASAPAFETLEFDVMARTEVANIDALVAIGSQDIDQVSDALIEVRFADDGFMEVRDGSAYDSETIFPYAPGVWYRIRVTADIANRSYDVQVGEDGEPLQILIEGAEFNAQADVDGGLTTWAMWSSQDATLDVALQSWMASGSCSSENCLSLGVECGQPSDGCGGNLSCGACAGGEACDSGACVESSSPPASCVPETCDSLYRDCGSANDGCGGVLSCGECATGEACTSWGACVDAAAPPQSCAPETCESSYRECGMGSDGCGGRLSCGECTSGERCTSWGSCVADTPATPACVPETCESLARECGLANDGCGGLVSCGGCASGESCSNTEVCEATTTPSSCVSETCASLGRECGGASDGCGGQVSCGGCGSGETCTSWGSCVSTAPSPPACVPETCFSLERECGSASDGCGGNLSCGGCASGKECSSGTCINAPVSVPTPTIPPDPGGPPSSGNTGITDYWCPRWDSLRSVISSPGTTTTSRYEYVEYDGYAYVNADDVTMRCTYGHRASGQSILACSDDGNPTTNCTQGLLVEDSEFFPTSASGVVDAAVFMVTDEGAINRSHLRTGCDGMKMNGGIFENSFIDISHKGGSIGWGCNTGDPHNDGIQLTGANYGPMWIMNNTIQGIDTSAIILCDGPMSDITAQNNRFSGGAWTTYIACDKSNTSIRASNWVGNEYIEGKWSVGPVDTSKVTGCFEAKTAGGAWANTYYPSGDPIDTEYFPGSSQNHGTCPRSSKWPRSWPDNAITNPPYWTVKSTTLPERSSCTRGNALCNDIDISASASGYTPRGSVTGYAHRWRYNCGGTSANTMNDGTEARTPCTRGHCLGGYQDDKADLWYDYPPCNGLASCTFANVCDFSAEGAGTYKVKVYSESGPGTGVRVSDHKEVTFTVNP